MHALAAWPNQDVDYDCWLKVGMALHSTSQPWAREVWDTWSQQSTKYDAVKQEKSWCSFDEDRDKKATLGTLFYLAQQAGWQPPSRAIPDMTQPPAPDPNDPEAHLGALAHRLPDHLRDNPDPRVRHHWRRVYRNINELKQRYSRDPYALVVPSHAEGASHGH